MFSDDQLSDAFTIFYNKLFIRKVHQDYAYFASVVSIYVPGALRTVIPFLAANPLRGRTCASNPTGNSIKSPVLTMARSKGFNVMGSKILARRSIPAEASVS